MANPIFKLLDTKTSVDDKTRTVEVICSTESADRIGDVIVQEGIDTTRYRKNPVVLWGHDSDRPIARADKVFLQNGQLRAVAEFPPAGEDADADWAYGKIKNRLVNAVSIGFIPKEYEPVDPKNPWDGYKFLESEMVEFSFVSVPMNAEALIVGRSLMPAKRDLLPSRVKDAAGDSGQTDHSGDEPYNGGLAVHAHKSLPLNDDMGAYDGAGCTKDMMEGCGFGTDAADHATLKGGFLLHDDSKPGLKKSYQLPFGNFIDGKMTAHKAGIESAAKKLGNRTDVPADVHAKAMEVVNHYRGRFEEAGNSASNANTSPKTDNSDTRSGDRLVLTKGWESCGSHDLPIDDSDSWDGPAAEASIFAAAGFNDSNPDPAKARKGFLVCDTDKPTEKGSYKLPFAHVVDGTLKAVKGGIRAAASRLHQTDAPADVLAHAQTTIDHYEHAMGIGDASDDGKALTNLVLRVRSAVAAAAVVSKAGRKLSAENEGRIRDAHDSLNTGCGLLKAVLDELPDTTNNNDPNPDNEDVRAADGIRRRRADIPGRSEATQFPRRTAREVELLKMRAAL